MRLVNKGIFLLYATFYKSTGHLNKEIRVVGG